MRNLTPHVFTDEVIAASGQVNLLLWIGLIFIADDQGRLLDNPALIRSMIFPYDEKLSTSTIEKGLQYFSNKHKLTRYVAGSNGTGRKLLQINNWWKYQRSAQWASRSSFQAPQKWIDRIRMHVAGGKIETVNWDVDGGYIETTKPLQRRESKKQVHSPKVDAKLSKEDDVNGDVKDESLLLLSSEHQEFIKSKHPEWINEAIKEATSKNRLRPSYVKGILKNWIVEGKDKKGHYGNQTSNRVTKRADKPQPVQANYSAERRAAAERILADKRASKTNV